MGIKCKVVSKGKVQRNTKRMIVICTLNALVGEKRGVVKRKIVVEIPFDKRGILGPSRCNDAPLPNGEG